MVEDSLLREVDEAVRADRALAWWNNNRRTIVVCVAAVILLTAANSAWNYYRQVQGAKALTQFIDSQQLLEEGKADEAVLGFEAIASSHRGELRDLARVWQARALVKAGQKDTAITVLATAARDGDSLWSDIACLRLAGLDATAALPCLTSAKATPLVGERAQWAAAAQWSNGERDAAIKGIEKLIGAESTTQESRAQLMQWLSIMKAQKGRA
jgi:hypothetical protein